MTRSPAGRLRPGPFLPILALALAASVGLSGPAHAQAGFPSIPVWAFPGAFIDSTAYSPYRCLGSFKGLPDDTLREQARTITVRFKRDRLAEARKDFGGYRIYRVTNYPDTSSMVLIRRYSRQTGDDNLWHFSVVDTSTLQFMCDSAVAGDSVVTFVDPDSSGSFEKVCRRVDNVGRCLSVGDSVFKLIAPPGPHDGFKTWYSITYEARNTTDKDYLDLFVPDTSDNYARCDSVGKPGTCPNLNNKARNMIAVPVEPTPGPTSNLERVAVVPNPYRATEAWDTNGGHEIHFINLPAHSKISIYTVSGELVRRLQHDDTVRDFERWDLKNGRGQDVASGIYVYRVVSDQLSFQDRFVIIR